MNSYYVAVLLGFYGIFLILAGIFSVVFIGRKAKTALISGGISGLIAFTSGIAVYNNFHVFAYIGLVLSLALFIVFSWRSTKTLFAIFKMIAEKDVSVNLKGIAFLIISLMAVISMVVFMLQLILFIPGFL